MICDWEGRGWSGVGRHKVHGAGHVRAKPPKQVNWYHSNNILS